MIHIPVRTVSIYSLIDPRTNKVRYIGKTVLTLQKRLYHHLYDKSDTHKCRWIKSLMQLNLVPIIQEIEKCLESEWEERERVWIAYYKKYGDCLTNCTDGGDGVYGLTRTEEHKNKIRESLKGHTVSEETKLKISMTKLNRSYHHSDEAKAKISLASKGRKLGPRSEEHKLKISITNKGKKKPPRTEEHKLKLNAAQKARVRSPLSEEHKAKLRIATTRWHERRKVKGFL